MKKLILFLLPLFALAQNPTNFPYGIKNAAAISDSTPAYFTTTQADGVHKKTPAAIIEKTANKTSTVTNYSETLYPNEKAVHDGLDMKLNISDLPTNLTLYPTNVASDVAGYVKMVTDIHDADYNTIAVDVSTPAITTTSQLVSRRISAPGVLIGQPGVFNITTFGNIRHLSGTGTATFYFEVYHRDSAGVETLICTSSISAPVIDGGYTEFTASALWDDGIFDATDRIVIKSYANRIAGGSDPVYQFQFGGATPVRTLLPVPFSVVDAGYEMKANKQNSLAVDGSGIKYPTVDAVNVGLNLKANLASPTFTGTVSGITKAMVGLGNVDNTSDANKPVSTATQTALNLKANQSSIYTKSEVDSKIANLNAAYHVDFIDSGTHNFTVPDSIIVQNVNLNNIPVYGLEWSQTGTTVSVTTSVTGDKVTLNGGSFVSVDFTPYARKDEFFDYVVITGTAESTQGFYFYGNGDFNAASGYYSKKFTIDPTKENYATSVVDGDVTALAIYLDVNGDFISFQEQGVNGGMDVFTRFPLVVPSNAAEVLMTSKISYATLEEGGFAPAKMSDLEPLDVRISDLENSAIDYVSTTGTPEAVQGFYFKDNGDFNAASGYYSKKFPVNPLIDTYISSTVDGDVTALAIYMDASNNFISNEKLGINGSPVTYVREKLNLPNNAAYVLTSSRIQHAVVEEYRFAPVTKTQVETIVDERLNLSWKNKTIAWFGTSIPETGYPQLVASILEATVTNEAKGSSMVRRGKIDVSDGYGWTGLAWENVGFSLSQTIAEKNELITNWNTWKTLLTNTPPAALDSGTQALFLDCSYENRLYRHLTSKGGVSKDLYIFDHGHNDNLGFDSDAQFINVPASSRDRNTFIGSVNVMIDEILKDNPRAKIVFIGHYENDRKTRISLAQETLAEYWDFPLLKLWEKLGFTQQVVSTTGYWTDYLTWNNSGGSLTNKTITEIWMHDDLHPFSIPTKTYIANNIADWLNSIK